METFNSLPSGDVVETTQKMLIENGFLCEIVMSGSDALVKIKELITPGASVQNGASVTLDQIGYIDYLKAGEHGWNNLHDAILLETDKEKQTKLRKEAVLSDFYVGSVHAVSTTGELVIASNTGSQLPHLAFTSPNIILVVSAQKITGTLSDALQRVEEYVVPLEDNRMMEQRNIHTLYAKTLILHKENPAVGRKVHIILVNEKLGF